MHIFTYLVIESRMAYFNQNNRQDDRGSYGGGGRRGFGDRGGAREDRRMYPAVCDKCGRECEVPFMPDGSKPIYCSNCFEKKQSDFGQGRDSYGGRRQFGDRSGGQSPNLNGEVLASINSKLAQILELMRSGDKGGPSQEKVETKVEKKVKKTGVKKNKKDK